MPTLTSTGNVNLTSSTNWSPAQIPAAGDDLVIGAHTLTVDADITLNRITVNSASSRMVNSGSRTLTLTNDINYNWAGTTSGFGNAFCNVSSGVFTIIGTHSLNVSQNRWVFNCNGGTLNLYASGSDPSAVLFTLGRTTPLTVLSTTNCTLNTIGRIVSPTPTSQSNTPQIVIGSNTVWTHNNTGTSFLNLNGYVNGDGVFQIDSGSTVNWTGNLEIQGGLGAGGPCIRSLGNVTFNGTLTGNSPSSNSVSIITIAGGTFNLNGKIIQDIARSTVLINHGGGTFNYLNQTVVIAANERFWITGTAAVNYSGTEFQVSGQWLHSAINTTTVDASTRVVVYAGGRAFAFASNVPIIDAPDPAPTLPPANNVTKDVVYGYAASPITGTGLIVDPAILAAAVQAGVGLASPNLDEQLDGIATDIANITVDNTAIAEAVRVELTDELDIVNNIPDSFDAIATQIDDISTVVYVSPAAFTSPGKVTGRTLRPYYKDTSRIGPIGIADSTRTPIDLSAFESDLYVSVMDSDTLEVLLYDDDPYFVTSNLYIDPSPESVGVLNAPLCWALRRISDNKTLMEGPWEVQFAAYGTE